jgi:hypothetical protein
MDTSYTSLKDFNPFNKWKVDPYGSDYQDGQPMYIIDQTTGKRYFNETKGCVRTKCSLLTLGTPFVHSIAAILNLAYRILRLITFYHFSKDDKKYTFKTRLIDAGKDFLRIVATPFSIIGLELSAIYGIFRPYDGRKLYASFERAEYGNFILAPCFQPDPRYHALGGNVYKRNDW